MLEMALDTAPVAADVTPASWLLSSLEMLDAAAEVKEDRLARSVGVVVSIAPASASASVAVVVATLTADVSAVADEAALLMMDSMLLATELAAAEVVSWL